MTTVAPWPVRGGFSLRSARLLEHLALEWDLHLVIATSGPVQPSAPPLEGGRHRVTWVRLARPLGAVPSGGTDPDRRRVDESVRAIVSRESADAVLLWPGAEFLAFAGTGLPPVVVDRVDSATAERLRGLRRAPGGWWRLGPTAWYERRIVRSAAWTAAAGASDARWLEWLGGRPVPVIVNGVAAAQTPDFNAESPFPSVAFTGTLDYPPNVDATRVLVHRVWPAVRRRIATARLVIAGRRPSRKVLALGATPGVEIRPDLDDLNPVLRASWLAVAPMRTGTGVKNKVLEAWAVGRPVVMTELAANGLDLTPGLAGLVTRGWDAMASRIAELLEDRPRRQALGQLALETAASRHRWDLAARSLSILLRAAAGQP